MSFFKSIELDVNLNAKQAKNELETAANKLSKNLSSGEIDFNNKEFINNIKEIRDILKGQFSNSNIKAANENSNEELQDKKGNKTKNSPLRDMVKSLSIVALSITAIVIIAKKILGVITDFSKQVLNNNSKGLNYTKEAFEQQQKFNFSDAENYAYSKAKDKLNYSDEEYFLGGYNEKRRAKRDELFEVYKKQFQELSNNGTLQELEKLNETWESFKEKLENTIIKFFVNNAGTLITTMESILSVLEALSSIIELLQPVITLITYLIKPLSYVMKGISNLLKLFIGSEAVSNSVNNQNIVNNNTFTFNNTMNSNNTGVSSINQLNIQTRQNVDIIKKAI